MQVTVTITAMRLVLLRWCLLYTTDVFFRSPQGSDVDICTCPRMYAVTCDHALELRHCCVPFPAVAGVQLPHTRFTRSQRPTQDFGNCTAYPNLGHDRRLRRTRSIPGKSVSPINYNLKTTGVTFYLYGIDDEEHKHQRTT